MTCFYKDLFTTAEQDKFASDELYSVARLMDAEFNFYVARVFYDSAKIGVPTTVEFCDLSGVPIAYLRRTPSDESKTGCLYTLYVYADKSFLDFVTSPSSYPDRLIKATETTSFKYLLNYLTRAKQQGGLLGTARDRNNRNITYTLSCALQESVCDPMDRVSHRAYKLDLPNSLTTKLVDLYGHQSTSMWRTPSPPDFSDSDREVLENSYNSINIARTKNAEHRASIHRYFGGDRFVLFYDETARFVLFGAARYTNIDAVLDSVFASHHSFYDGPTAHVETTMPVRRYKNLDALPESVRDVVLSTIHLDKLNRASWRPFKSSSNDLLPIPESSFPVSFTNSSSTCYRLALPGVATVYNIPDKRRLLV